jgi:hypothetical protein
MKKLAFIIFVVLGITVTVYHTVWRDIGRVSCERLADGVIECNFIDSVNVLEFRADYRNYRKKHLNYQRARCGFNPEVISWLLKQTGNQNKFNAENILSAAVFMDSTLNNADYSYSLDEVAGYTIYYFEEPYLRQYFYQKQNGKFIEIKDVNVKVTGHTYGCDLYNLENYIYPQNSDTNAILMIANDVYFELDKKVNKDITRKYHK